MSKHKIISSRAKYALKELDKISLSESNPLFSLIICTTNLTPALDDSERYMVKMKYLMKYIEYLGVPEMWAIFDSEKHNISDFSLPGVQEILHSDVALFNVESISDLVHSTVGTYLKLYESNAASVEEVKDIEAYLRVLLSKILDAPVSSQVDREVIRAMCQMYLCVKNNPRGSAEPDQLILTDIRNRIMIYFDGLSLKSIETMTSLAYDLYQDKEILHLFLTEFLSNE